MKENKNKKIKNENLSKNRPKSAKLGSWKT
jgi:hypothetical protein